MFISDKSNQLSNQPDYSAFNKQSIQGIYQAQFPRETINSQKKLVQV